MSQKISAGCLCGKIRFETTHPPFMQVLCHCTDCQKVSGAPFYTAYIVAQDAVQLTQGEPGGFEVESDHGRKNFRRFCRDCGTRLWAELENGVASVNGMAFDDQSVFEPSHNHRLETAPSWCPVSEGLEVLPT